METVVLALRVALSLAVVLGLLWVLQRRFSRGARTGARKLVRVVERQTIGPKASVVVVDADGQRFLLGVTDQAVNVLDSREAPAEEEAQPAHRAPQTASDSFARLLELATGRAAGKDQAAGRAPARAAGTGQATAQTTAQYDGGASPRRAAAPAAGAGRPETAVWKPAVPEAAAAGDASNPFDAAVAGPSAAPAAADLPRRAARRAGEQPQPAEADAYGYDQPSAEQEPTAQRSTSRAHRRHRCGRPRPDRGGRRSERTGRRASRAAGCRSRCRIPRWPAPSCLRPRGSRRPKH